MPSNSIPAKTGPSGPATAIYGQAGAGDELGDQDVQYELRLAVTRATGNLAAESGTGVVRMGLMPASRGLVIARLEAARDAVIERTVVQLSQVESGSSGCSTPTEPGLGPSEVRLQVQLVIWAKHGDLARENWQGSLSGILDSPDPGQMGSRLRETCESTFRKAIIGFNSCIVEREVRINEQPRRQYDWSLVRQLLEGKGKYPVESLPDPVRIYAESLAARCSLPVCVPATACLALASGLAGKGFKLDRGLGSAIGLNLYFAVAVNPNAYFRPAVESVLGPARGLQDELIGGEPYAEGPIQSTSPLAEWKRQQGGGQALPPLLSSGEQLLESSPVELFHCCWDEELMLDMVEKAEKRKRHPATRVLKRAYTGDFYDSSSQRNQKNKRVVQPQSIGLLCLCSRDGLLGFARSRPLLQDGVLRCLILVDSEAEPAGLTTAVLEPTQGALDWERILRDIVGWSLKSEHQIWNVCPEGAELLGLFANLAFTHMNATVAPDYRMVPEWEDRVWRMTGLLQLLSGSWNALIEPNTAWNAILLTAWYLGRHLMCFSSSRAKLSPPGAVSKNDVLERLREEPLSDTELLHAFHRITAAERQRITSELFQEGLIKKDDHGKWVVCEKATAPA